MLIYNGTWPIQGMPNKANAADVKNARLISSVETVEKVINQLKRGGLV